MKEFTEDEKIIARNINKKYRWIARDECGSLHVYTLRPVKKKDMKRWGNISCEIARVSVLFGGGLFKSIKWEDDEPTRISDIYNPQILDDVEREYLKTVLKPFRKELGFAVKFGEHFDDIRGCYTKEYLFIKLHGDDFFFPSFDAGKMYSGMKRNKEYTLDELGITYDD